MLTKNWDLISIAPYDLNINPTRVKLGHRWCPNLKDKLCAAMISYPPTDSPITGRNPSRDPARVPEKNKCKNKNCTYCPIIQCHGRVISHQTLRTYHAPMGVTCRSNNLIYLITCKKCLAQYVGETYRRLFKRMAEHLRSIRNDSNTPVGYHFNHSRAGCNISHVQFEVASFIYTPVHPNSEQGINIRRTIEKKWIHRMRTNRFPGLNIQD